MRWTTAVCLFLLAGFLSGQGVLVDTAVAQQQSSDQKGWQETPKPVAQRNREGVTDETRRARGAYWEFMTPNIVSSKPRVPREGEIIRGYFSDSILPPKPFSLCKVGSIFSMTMTDFQPFLSNNQTHIYTELYFRVEEVLKSNRGDPVVGQDIATSLPGGTLQLPNGEILQGRNEGRSPLRTGHRYVVFVDNFQRPKDTYSWWKILEIQNGRMKPLGGDGEDVFEPKQNWLTAKPPLPVLAGHEQEYAEKPPAPKVAGMPVEQFMDEVRRRLSLCPN